MDDHRENHNEDGREERSDGAPVNQDGKLRSPETDQIDILPKGAIDEESIGTQLDKAPIGETIKVDPSEIRPVLRFGDANMERLYLLRFVFVSENNLTLKMEFEHELILGRGDADTDLQVDLNLSPYRATEQGVSRQHLKVMRRKNTLYVTDLGSTNGTYLNGEQLVKGQLRVLRDGDELQLGTLPIIVYFDRDN